MQNLFQNILETFRDHAITEREKGSYFEALTIAFLENDARYKQQFIKVQINQNKKVVTILRK